MSSVARATTSAPTPDEIDGVRRDLRDSYPDLAASGTPGLQDAYRRGDPEALILAYEQAHARYDPARYVGRLPERELSKLAVLSGQLEEIFAELTRKLDAGKAAAGTRPETGPAEPRRRAKTAALKPGGATDAAAPPAAPAGLDGEAHLRIHVQGLGSVIEARVMGLRKQQLDVEVTRCLRIGDACELRVPVDGEDEVTVSGQVVMALPGGGVGKANRMTLKLAELEGPALEALMRVVAAATTGVSAPEPGGPAKGDPGEKAKRSRRVRDDAGFDLRAMRGPLIAGAVAIVILVVVAGGLALR